MNTKFEYMYRDAANYKVWETVVVRGELDEAAVRACLENISEGVEFIPSQVGLEDLQPQMTTYPSADDHVWHSVCDEPFEKTDDTPTTDMAAEELLKKFQEMKGKWDVKAACLKHGFEFNG